MKHILLIGFLYFSMFLQGQEIEKILYRGESINVYPTDSITMVDIKLIPNLPDGTYFGFFKGDTAFLRLKISYLNEKINGTVIEYYYRNMDVEKTTDYVNGVKHGYSAEYGGFFNKPYEISYEGYYANGNKEGLHFSYNWNKGEKSVYNKEYYRNDTLIYKIWQGRDSTFYVKDTGYVFEFDGAKNLVGTGKSYKEERFGYWKRYNSVWDIWSQGEYELWNWSLDSFPDSRQVGVWEDYYTNGQLSRRYLFDRKIRKWGIATVIVQYDINGKLLDSMSFVNGVGLYKEFYPSGMLKREEYYSKPDDLKYEKYYSDSDGHAVLTEYPTDSTKVRTCYYPSGQIESIENYKAVFWLDWGRDEPYPAEYAKFGKQQYFSKDGSLLRSEEITEIVLEE